MLDRIIDLLIYYSPTIAIIIILYICGRIWWRNT